MRFFLLLFPLFLLGQELAVVKAVKPQYPKIARADQARGEVKLEALIRPDGSVANVEVLESQNRILAEAARQNLSLWQFEKDAGLRREVFVYCYSLGPIRGKDFYNPKTRKISISAAHNRLPHDPR